MKLSSSKLELLAAAALALGSAACSMEARAERAPNVVLVCLDTVRADHLGCYGYEERATTPFLDRIAEQALRFDDASATACWTKPSVPSIFTGTLPMQHGVYRGSARDEAGTFSDVLPEEAVTLAEAFGESGYQTAAFVKNSQLRAGLGFEQGFELYRDRAGDAKQIRWQASDWLDQRDAERPFFLYLHYLDAHWPYPVPQEYAEMFTEQGVAARIQSGDWRALRDAINHGEQQMSAQDLEALIALYDGSIRYMDDQLAQLWEKLEREDLTDNTILCVVSDHGEEFLEHGRLGHGHGLYENLLDVPWILRVPGVEARTIEARVSLLDLYPTLLSAAGISAQGRGLPGIDRMLAPEQRMPTISEHLEPHKYQVSWSQAGEKWIETLEPVRGGAASRGLVELEAHGRWEARLKLSGDGRRIVERLRPAEDQDEDELEIKGPIGALAGDTLTIAGIAISTPASTELYGALADEQGATRELALGMQVKARGALREGVFVARKLKLYPASDELEIELRGPLSVSDATRVEVAGYSAVVDQDSELDLGGEDNDLGPQDVVSILSGDARLRERELRRYDLANDRQEHSPLDGDSQLLGDEARRMRLQTYLSQRFWGEGHKQRLGESELQELRKIGYAE